MDAKEKYNELSKQAAAAYATYSGMDSGAKEERLVPRELMERVGEKAELRLVT